MKKYPIGGYAPGSYWCTCKDCEETFLGDKRSNQCETCGTKSNIEFNNKKEHDDKIRNIASEFVEEFNIFGYANLKDGSTIKIEKLLVNFTNYLNEKNII